MGFVMKYYDNIYDHFYSPPPGLPRFSFWRAGLSIWGQKMGAYHAENGKVYNYVTGKLRENSLLGYLGSKTERLPSVYRYPLPHSASFGMKPSSTASVTFSRTRLTSKPTELSTSKPFWTRIRTFTTSSPRTTWSTLWTCLSTRSLFIGAGIPTTRLVNLQSTVKSLLVFFRVQKATTVT
jgi:hypothetical protein